MKIHRDNINPVVCLCYQRRGNYEDRKQEQLLLRRKEIGVVLKVSFILWTISFQFSWSLHPRHPYSVGIHLSLPIIQRKITRHLSFLLPFESFMNKKSLRELRKSSFGQMRRWIRHGSLCRQLHPLPQVFKHQTKIFLNFLNGMSRCYSSQVS